MRNVEILRPRSTKELEVAVDNSFDGGRHVLLLFDDKTIDSQDKFFSEYLLRRTFFPPYDSLVHVTGDDITTADEFYAKCRTSIHLADYMGSNLDALADILRFEALSPDPTKRTLWVWSNAHVLYSNDSLAFQQLFETMIDCSMYAISGELGSIGSFNLPARPVKVLLTGTWEVMGDEASRDDSFLYWLRQTWFKPQPPDKPTGVLTLRISR